MLKSLISWRHRRLHEYKLHHLICIQAECCPKYSKTFPQVNLLNMKCDGFAFFHETITLWREHHHIKTFTLFRATVSFGWQQCASLPICFNQQYAEEQGLLRQLRSSQGMEEKSPSRPSTSPDTLSRGDLNHLPQVDLLSVSWVTFWSCGRVGQMWTSH